MKIKETTTYKIEMHSDDIAVLEDAKDIILKAINKPDINKAINFEALNTTHNTLQFLLNIAIGNDNEPAINTMCNGSYDNGYSDGRAQGYDEGHLDGYDEGYEDGYSACVDEMSEKEEDDE